MPVLAAYVTAGNILPRKDAVNFVRPAVKVVLQNDGDVADVTYYTYLQQCTALYPRGKYPLSSMLFANLWRKIENDSDVFHHNFHKRCWFQLFSSAIYKKVHSSSSYFLE